MQLCAESHRPNNLVPSNLYKAKELIQKLGLAYKKFDYYVNGCMLYTRMIMMKDNVSFMLLCIINSLDLVRVSEKKYHLIGSIICHLFQDVKDCIFQ